MKNCIDPSAHDIKVHILIFKFEPRKNKKINTSKIVGFKGKNNIPHTHAQNIGGILVQVNTQMYSKLPTVLKLTA